MLTGTIIRTSLTILAAAVAATTQAQTAQAHSSSCTPPHLVSVLKQVEAQCGAAKVVSGHRPGARIRGTGRVSQHSFCDGQRGAIDAVFTNRACALSALRKTNYTILTYGWSSHIHVGTDGWGGGGHTRMATNRASSHVRAASRRNGTRFASVRSRHAFTRHASTRTASLRYASRQRAGVRVAHGQWSNDRNGWGGGDRSSTAHQ